MIANSNFNHLTPEEYLVLEETSPIKHEYRYGQADARAGASNNHVSIIVNLVALLRNHVRGSGCKVYSSDTKVHIEKIDLYYYPDVVVSCDDRDRALTTFIRYPKLIIEVLSDSTEAFDRGDKFEDYRYLDSLQEYVLISQKRQRIECFRRNAEGTWVLHSFQQQVEFASIGFSCAIEDVYEDVDFSLPTSS